MLEIRLLTEPSSIPEISIGATCVRVAGGALRIESNLGWRNHVLPREVGVLRAKLSDAGGDRKPLPRLRNCA